MKIRNTSNFVTALVIFISVITVILCVSIVETRSAATVNAVKPEEYVADYLEERLVEDYTKATGITDCAVYNADELTADILTHRNGKIIIERCIGEVTNASTGDGMVLNTDDPEHNYISYRGTDLHLRNGTMVVTFLCYNPETNGEDDVLDRYDYILTRDYER